MLWDAGEGGAEASLASSCCQSPALGTCLSQKTRDGMSSPCKSQLLPRSPGPSWKRRPAPQTVKQELLGTCFSGRCRWMTSSGGAGHSDPAGPAPLGSFGKNFPKRQCFVFTPVVAVTSAFCQAVFAAKLWTHHWETQGTRCSPGGQDGVGGGGRLSAAGGRAGKGWLGPCVPVHTHMCTCM